MSLMYRRPMQIAPDVFDTSIAGELTIEDFYEPTQPTRFQEANARKLQELFLLQVRLAHAVSDLNTIAYPGTGLLGPHVLSVREYFETMDRIQAAGDCLDAWLSELNAKHGPELQCDETQKPVLLFYNVLIMSYQ